MTRRSALRLLGWSALAAPLLGCAGRAPGALAGASLAESVCFYSTRQMANAVASGELSSVALVEACLERIERTLEVVLPIYFWDGGAAVRRLLQQAGTVAHGLQMFTEAEAVPHVQADAAHAALDQWRSELLGFVTDCPLIVAPVNASAAYSAGFATNDAVLAQSSYAFPHNVTGWPVVVVPAGWSEQGLPIGVQIIAGPGREDIALAAAAVVEQSLAAYRRPTI